MGKNRKKKGQSTLEYILLATGVVAAMIIFLGQDGPFMQTINEGITEVADGFGDMSTRIDGSRPLDNTH